MPCSVTKLFTRFSPKNLFNKYHEPKNGKKSKKKKSNRCFSLQNNDSLRILVNHIILKVLIIILTGTMLQHKCYGSLVIDKTSEDNVMFSQYCPSTPNCPEGAHVMCMFYNPRSQYGPECIDPANLTMDLERANWLLDIFNAMRSKVARGEETGKGGVRLPRAFGLIRLQWDSELATFAQILADQCTENLYDQCRATKRFPEPYQFVLGVQDRIDRWYIDKIPLKKPWQSGKILNEDKINEVIHMIFRHAYTMKNSITPENIVNPGKMRNHYINFVGSASTHIGCAYILFSRYHPYNVNNFEKMLQLVCNLSGSPEKGKPVYRTKPPGPEETDITKKCGCPKGYAEDSGCLCYAIENKDANWGNLRTQQQVACRDDPKCKPAVVVLPIITFEDAPPSHWLDHSGNSSEVDMRSNKNMLKRRFEMVPTPATRHLIKSQLSDDRKTELFKRKNKPGKRQSKYKVPVERRHIIFKNNKTPNVEHLIDTYENIRPLEDSAKNNEHYESFTNIIPHETEDFIGKRYTFASNDTISKGRNLKQENRNNLITLLNKLEHEVKHINLDGAAKNLLDTKILSIYDKLLSLAEEVSSPKPQEKNTSNEEVGNYNDDNIDTVMVIPRPDYAGGPIIRELLKNKQSNTKSLGNNEREYAVSNLRNQKSFHSGVSNVRFENFNTLQKIDTKINNNGNDYTQENSLRTLSYNNDQTDIIGKPKYRGAVPFRRVDNEERETKRTFYVKSFNREDDDFLSTERRKFYQEKLDKVKRKFENEQTLPKEFEADRPVRRVRPASYSNTQVRKQFREDRDPAVLLHGF